MRPWTEAIHYAWFAPLIELQWGHGLAAVDGGFMWLIGVHLLSLQWGHGLAAVDGRTSMWSDVSVMPASMGPRPCGRGRIIYRS